MGSSYELDRLAEKLIRIEMELRRIAAGKTPTDPATALAIAVDEMEVAQALLATARSDVARHRT